MSGALITLWLPPPEALLGPIFAFGRVSGLLHSMPILSTKMVPRQVRLVLAVAIVVVLAPSLPAAPPDVSRTLGHVILSFGSEVAAGLAMGFVASTLLHVFEVAGTFVGFHSGFSNAVLFDPVTQSQSLVISRIFMVAGMVAFLGFDVHHHILVALVDTFRSHPPGLASISPAAGPEVSRAIAQMMLDAMRITMPVFAATLFLNVMWSLVTRFAQQMNVYFSIGMSVNAVVGVLTTLLCIPATIALVRDAGPSVRSIMVRVLGG